MTLIEAYEMVDKLLPAQAADLVHKHFEKSESLFHAIREAGAMHMHVHFLETAVNDFAHDAAGGTVEAFVQMVDDAIERRDQRQTAAELAADDLTDASRVPGTGFQTLFDLPRSDASIAEIVQEYSPTGDMTQYASWRVVSVAQCDDGNMARAFACMWWVHHLRSYLCCILGDPRTGRLYAQREGNATTLHAEFYGPASPAHCIKVSMLLSAGIYLAGPIGDQFHIKVAGMTDALNLVSELLAPIPGPDGVDAGVFGVLHLASPASQ